MIMNDKQKNIIDKLNKDNESLNQGHKSMVEYSGNPQLDRVD